MLIFYLSQLFLNTSKLERELYLRKALRTINQNIFLAVLCYFVVLLSYSQECEQLQEKSEFYLQEANFDQSIYYLKLSQRKGCEGALEKLLRVDSLYTYNNSSGTVKELIAEADQYRADEKFVAEYTRLAELLINFPKLSYVERRLLKLSENKEVKKSLMKIQADIKRSERNDALDDIHQKIKNDRCIEAYYQILMEKRKHESDTLKQLENAVLNTCKDEIDYFDNLKIYADSMFYHKNWKEAKRSYEQLFEMNRNGYFADRITDSQLGILNELYEFKKSDMILTYAREWLFNHSYALSRLQFERYLEITKDTTVTTELKVVKELESLENSDAGSKDIELITKLAEYYESNQQYELLLEAWYSIKGVEWFYHENQYFVEDQITRAMSLITP